MENKYKLRGLDHVANLSIHLKVCKRQLTRIDSRRLFVCYHCYAVERSLEESTAPGRISYALPFLIFKRDTDTFGTGPDCPS